MKCCSAVAIDNSGCIATVRASMSSATAISQQKMLLSFVSAASYLNIRSLVNKLSKFQSYVYSTPYNIYCVSETGLHDSTFDGEILSYGYTIYPKDRGARGGGVLIAIEDSVSSSSLPSPTDLEV